MKSKLNKLRFIPLLQVIALAASSLCAGQAALAEGTKIFEWRDANGVKSYSQLPPPQGMRGVTSFEIDTKILSPTQRAAVKAHLARIDAAEQADSLRFRRQVAAADQAVSSALRLLSKAEGAAREGRTPQAGERVGNAGGGSRLRSEYFDRQKRLEDAIQEAKVSVDEAYRQRNQIMP